MKQVGKKELTGDRGIYTTHAWLVWQLQAVAKLIIKRFPWTK